MAYCPDDDAVSLDRVQDAVTPDAGRPTPSDPAEERFAGSLGIESDSLDRSGDGFAHRLW
jgi:hypothetical protein